MRIDLMCEDEEDVKKSIIATQKAARKAKLAESLLRKYPSSNAKEIVKRNSRKHEIIRDWTSRYGSNVTFAPSDFSPKQLDTMRRIIQKKVNASTPDGKYITYLLSGWSHEYTLELKFSSFYDQKFSYREEEILANMIISVSYDYET